MFDKSTIERFWRRIDKRGPDECWHWKPDKPGKYGILYANGRRTVATHIALYLDGRPRPPSPYLKNEMFALHSCDNPPCCNPAHEMWFIGCRLMRCLTVGAKAEVGCWTFSIADLTEEPDFWERYIAMGRCAIDEKHERSFIGDQSRWAAKGDIRHCLWCGDCEQHLTRWTETVARERWEARALAAQAPEVAS